MLQRDPRNFDRRDVIAASGRRLVDKLGMGEQYKAMAVTPRIPGDEYKKEVFPVIGRLEQEAEGRVLRADI